MEQPKLESKEIWRDLQETIGEVLGENVELVPLSISSQRRFGLIKQGHEFYFVLNNTDSRLPHLRVTKYESQTAFDRDQSANKDMAIRDTVIEGNLKDALTTLRNKVINP